MYNFKENMFTVLLLEFTKLMFQVDMNLYPRKV